MKEFYEVPAMTMVRFEAEDIITTSEMLFNINGDFSVNPERLVEYGK